MKIGILTFQWSNNYGATLQSFALKTFLSNLQSGEVSVINYNKTYPKPKSSINSKIKDFILFFLLIPDKKKIRLRNRRFDEFRSDFFDLTKKYHNQKELDGIDFEYLFFGSDQIWNPKLTGGNLDPVYFGYFNTGAKRIAYSASIGERNVRQSDVGIITEYLSRLNCISVRESQMLDEISKYTDKQLVHTLDPTLLLNEEEYRSISGENKLTEKYLLIYQNTRNNEIYKIAEHVAKKRGLKIYEVGYRRQFPSVGVPMIVNAGPREFLALYRDAEYIVTNTFHGTVFSIIFKKQFISIPLSGREHRVMSLAQKLCLENRLINEYDFLKVDRLMENVIDYCSVSQKLKVEREKSIEYIKESLDGEVKWD